MIDYAVACRCPVCWCLAPASEADDSICPECAAGNHPESERTAVANPAAPPPRKCVRHAWGQAVLPGDFDRDITRCVRCHQVRDMALARRSRNNRSRGNRHELHVARTYGGTKIGPLGGPADVVGNLFAIQVKTHQGPPPVRLLRLMEAMESGAGGRVPIVLDRYLRPGLPPIDLITVRGRDWIDLHGKDGTE